MNFRDLALARKLAVGFGAVMTVVAVSSAFIFVETRRVVEIERLNSASDFVINLIDQARGDLNGLRAETRKFVLTGKEADKSKASSYDDAFKKDIDSLAGMMAKEAPQLVVYLADYRAKAGTYIAKAIEPELSLASNPSTRSEAQAMVTDPSSGQFTADAEAAFATLRSKVDAWSDGCTEAGNQAMIQIQWVVALSGLVCILLGAAMAWLIVRAVGGPLTSITRVMRTLAAGDNTVAVPGLGRSDEIGQMAAAVQSFKDAAIQKVSLEKHAEDTRKMADVDRGRNDVERADAARQQSAVVDALASGLERLSEGQLLFRINEVFAPEYEKLRADFNGAMAKLQETMKAVSSNTTAIRSGTDEISSAADDLSRRTEQQAASLEETAAALDEITATVRKTAEGAKHARQVVGTATSDAEHSGQVVRQAVGAMQAIEKSAGQIGQIISVIDEIAFQTNLLALNAGVEAARAGDAGRGFAVVASEVRALAQRSAEAAKEIKTLISASSAHVGQGVELVGQTGQALERIFVQVSEINGVVAEIAASAQEQATALDQVNTAVNQMDQVTQQNAAMVEESTAASHALAEETEQLARLIGRFEVDQVQHLSTVRRSIQKVAPMPKAAARARPIAALKTMGTGQALRKPEVAEDWQEF